MKIICLFGLLVAVLGVSAYGQAGNCGQTDYQCKVAAFTAAIDAGGSSSENYYNRALAYQELGQHDEAVADLDKYIDSKPSNPVYLSDGYNSRALSRRKLGDREGSVVDSNMAIKLAPNNALARVTRGNTYRENSQFDLAIADYQAALKLDPKNKAARLNKAISYYGKKDYAPALVDLNALILADRNEAEAYYDRGLVYMDQGRNDEALADFTKYISLDVTDQTYWADGYLQRGVVRARKKDLAGSLTDLTKAASLNPNNPKIYRARAVTYRAMGKTALAADDESKAKELEGK